MDESCYINESVLLNYFAGQLYEIRLNHQNKEQ